MLSYSFPLTVFRPLVIVCLGGAEDAAVFKHSDDFSAEYVMYDNLVSWGKSSSVGEREGRECWGWKLQARGMGSGLLEYQWRGYASAWPQWGGGSVGFGGTCRKVWFAGGMGRFDP